ncbi:unnamed protein product, partial [Mesorhabditis belari]|uniref:G-protein coupled receptors family 1 profile domain-containing protein n=1 Tax=Mesorhabditis belari TaxID=2138241 RepID=A0AAF3EM77_9BILA
MAMYSYFNRIGYSRTWEKFQDLFLVLAIFIGLLATYSLSVNLYNQNWTLLTTPIDISDDLGNEIGDIILAMTDWAVILSLFTTPLAVYFSATNDRLSFPIRLLATAENANKFVFAVVYALMCYCSVGFVPFVCSQNTTILFSQIYSYANYYDLIDISQYCQLLISFRVIPVGWGLAYQFHGLCRKISPQFCVDVHSITLHCVAYAYSLLPLSFWYRYYVLVNGAPRPKTIALLCFIFYIPSFVSMILFAISTSPPALVRKMLAEQRNSSLFPDNPNIAAIAGFESVWQKTTLALISWSGLPIFPGYTASIIYRTRILRILEKSAMSEKSKEIQKKLVMALTIQAILPLFMMSQATVYIWRQFKLPYGESAPYFEECVFLSVAILSSINPLITIYFVPPYQKKVCRMMLLPFLRSKRKVHKAKYEQNGSISGTPPSTKSSKMDTIF